MDKINARDQRSIELPLNSFVRRTQQTQALKALITSCDGLLSRKGRSRNWQLVIPESHRKLLIDKIYQATEPSWLWIAKSLAELAVDYQAGELLTFAKSRPSITVKALMIETGCTAAEARTVLDDIEWS
jgi:Ribosome recycling factor